MSSGYLAISDKKKFNSYANKVVKSVLLAQDCRSAALSWAPSERAMGEQEVLSRDITRTMNAR